MKYWADFTDRLGSDATIRVDGRKRLAGMKQQAADHANRLRNIDSRTTRKCVIIRGESLLRAHPICDEFTIQVNHKKDEEATCN